MVLIMIITLFIVSLYSGSFSTDYSFVVYRPSSGDVELSSV